MNLGRSFTAFRRLWREDVQFRQLGRPAGWSLLIHYRGRWHDRRGTTMAPERVAFRHRGRPMTLELNDRYLGAFRGVFLDREYDCAAALSHSPRRILDLGGNIGFGSIFLHHLFPEAQFAVVEPDPRNVPLLRRNLAANGVPATVFAAAIGPVAGAIELRMGSDPACSSVAGTGLHDLDQSVRVPVTTVPAVLDAAGWDRADIAKVDIEGAEDLLFAEHNEWLARVDALLVEVHPNTSAERLNGFLAPHGLALERFGSGREPVHLALRRVPCASL